MGQWVWFKVAKLQSMFGGQEMGLDTWPSNAWHAIRFLFDGTMSGFMLPMGHAKTVWDNAPRGKRGVLLGIVDHWFCVTEHGMWDSLHGDIRPLYWWIWGAD